LQDDPLAIDSIALTAAEQNAPPPAPPAEGTGADGSSGSIGTVEKLGDAPPANTLQFLRTQAVLLKQGQCQFDWGLSYSVLDFRFANTQPGAGGGSVLVNDVERLRLLTIPLAFRYGVTDDLQAYFNLPVGYSSDELASSNESSTTQFGGLGDLSGGFSYHLCKSCGDPYSPDVIATIGFVAPTGPATFSTSLVASNSVLGQGFWQLTTNVLAIHTFDPCVFYYGGGYVHRFEADISNIQVQAGEEFDYLFGVGFAVNPWVTISGTMLGAYISRYSANDAIIPGSDQDIMRFRLGVTIVKGTHICEPFAEIGMTQDSPSRVGVVFTY
jgi:hypothetical protein